MDLHNAYNTAEWLLKYAYTDEMTPDEVLRVKQMRDCLYYLHAASGVESIRLSAYDMGVEDARREDAQQSG